MKALKSQRKSISNFAEHKLAEALDARAEFEEFQQSVLPALRKDLLAGKSAQELYDKYQALAAARGITIAATEIDSGKALAAIKDILDRTQGKAKESKEITHKLEKLSDEELDALIQAQKTELLEDEE